MAATGRTLPSTLDPLQLENGLPWRIVQPHESQIIRADVLPSAVHRHASCFCASIVTKTL
jgi:hypothetical protein